MNTLFWVGLAALYIVVAFCCAVLLASLAPWLRPNSVQKVLEYLGQLKQKGEND